MLLNNFYRGLGPENRGVANQLSPGGLIEQPYAIATQLLDHMTKTQKETEKDKNLDKMLTQLDLLAKKIMEFEVLYKIKDSYIPPHECRKSTDYEGGQVEEILSLILHKVEEHDKVLKEIKENVSMLNQMTASHSISIQLLETQMGHMFSRLYLRQQGDCMVILWKTPRMMFERGRCATMLTKVPLERQPKFLFAFFLFLE
uniref:Uncharacterized protein n=1 Tax=Solanum tuberosum TaxID=4113 RepID=M1DPC9_SOLTU